MSGRKTAIFREIEILEKEKEKMQWAHQFSCVQLGSKTGIFFFSSAHFFLLCLKVQCSITTTPYSEKLGKIDLGQHIFQHLTSQQFT